MTEPVLLKPRKLDITLQPMTRIVWASAAARAEWEPKVTSAANGWSAVERLSVAVGDRMCAQQWISVHELPELQEWCRENKLDHQVVRFTGSHQGFLQAGYPEGNSMAVVQFGAASYLSEKYFGYPLCCVEAFGRSFDNGEIDPMPTWGAPPAAPVFRSYAHPLLRYIGVRAVPHIPCNRNCEATIRDALRFLSLMTEEARNATLDILGLPVTWDRYRGVSIITTPHFRVVTTSTPRPFREIVQCSPTS